MVDLALFVRVFMVDAKSLGPKVLLFFFGLSLLIFIVHISSVAHLHVPFNHVFVENAMT